MDGLRPQKYFLEKIGYSSLIFSALFSKVEFLPVEALQSTLEKTRL
jgi:hypothetical protein